MSLQSDIAQKHQQDRIRITRQAQARTMQIWSAASQQDLDMSWNVLASRMVATVTAAQVASAKLATPYLDAFDKSYGRDAPSFELAPDAFGGVMLDGRALGPAMYTVVTTTKSGILAGMGAHQAFRAGMTALGVVVGAAVQDMGRQGDLTLMNARTYTRYVRVCSGQACSRCAILAGMASSREAFRRHTCCECDAAPVEVKYVDRKETHHVPDGFFMSPEDFFDSLSKADQDRVFTKAGAEAIRAGANPVSVVNARRGAYGIGYNSHYYTPVEHSGRRLQKITVGMKPDGSPLQVYATGEGVTGRGRYGRAERLRVGVSTSTDTYRKTIAIRLMPEQLVVMAHGDAAKLRDLLIRYGYGY